MSRRGHNSKRAAILMLLFLPEKSPNLTHLTFKEDGLSLILNVLLSILALFNNCTHWAFKASHTWQASTPPCRFPAHSILGVTASSYSLLHVFLLMIFTEASWRRVASSPDVT